MSRNTAASSYLLCWSLSGFEYWRQFVCHVLCIQSVHWHSYFQKTANIKWHYQLSFTRNSPWEGRTSSPLIPSRMVSETCLWKVSMSWGPTCTVVSSLVTNLVPFWRLLTYQSTILHCYLPAHARCATWHPVQHDILCNINLLYQQIVLWCVVMARVARKLTNLILGLCPWLTATVL